MPYKSSVLEVTTASTSIFLGGIVKQQASTGLKVQADVVMGKEYPIIGTINEVAPKISFSTKAIATALSTLGLTGAGFPITGGPQTVKLWEILYQDNGTIASGSVHRVLRMKAGRICPKNLKCSNLGDAELDVEIMAITDGIEVPASTFSETTPPIDFIENQAAPSFTVGQIDSERYTIGKATIESIVIGCIQDFSLDFNLDIKSNACNSNPYHSQIDVVSVSPLLTLQSRNASLLSDSVIKLQGKSATNTNTAIYLRKRKPRTAEFEDNISTVHVKITAQGLLHVTEAFNASGNENGNLSLALQGLWDGTNAPMVLNLASAIT